MTLRCSIRLLLVALVATWMQLPLGAQELRILKLELSDTGVPVIRHPSTATNYYILHRGTEITQIVTAADLAMGVPVEGELRDQNPPSLDAFYRVQSVPVASPLDTDRDGIDDVWELRFRRRGSALNPADANDDQNGSGTPDLVEYQLPVARFELASSLAYPENSNQVSVSISFSKPFAGLARVLLGGSAVYGEDYLINGYSPANQSAQAPAAASAASFVITLLDSPSLEPDRYLLLSLLEPAATNQISGRYQTTLVDAASHTLRITRGELGLYAGTLQVTNQAGLESHPIRLALRSSGNGGALGYFDATQSPTFRRGFTLPVTIDARGMPLAFPETFVFQTNSAPLQRSLTWSLQLGSVSRVQDLLEAPAILRLTGLTASGQSLVRSGQLRLVRIPSAP